MIHKIITSFGLGLLGIDPMSAVLILSMSLKKDNKTKISFFIFSFTFFAIIIGALISIIFGVTAINYVKKLIPNDDSPFWVILEIIVLLITLAIVFRRIFKNKNTEKAESKKEVNGSTLKYIGTGIFFALTSFTDPTYYGVILLGIETDNFLSAIILISIWFIVSQIMALITYIAVLFNFTNKLNESVERLKNKYRDKLSIIFNLILILVAIILIVDLVFYLVCGNYLF